MAHAFRPIPDDFADLAAEMTVNALHQHYSTGRKQVRRWLAQLGISPGKAKRRGGIEPRPVPVDFADKCAGHCRAELARLYGTSDKTIRRWLAKSGLEAKRYTPDPPPPGIRRKRTAPCGVSVNVRGVSQLPNVASTSKTIYDCAADTLRRERFTVYRCDDRGRFDLNGEYWRCGFSVMTSAELLTRAAKYERKAA